MKFTKTTLSCVIALLCTSGATVAHVNYTTHFYGKQAPHVVAPAYATKMNSAFTYDLSYSCAKKGIMSYWDPAAITAKNIALYNNCTKVWDKSVPEDVVAFNKNISSGSTVGINQLYVYGSDLEFDDGVGAQATLSPAKPHVHAADGAAYSGTKNIENYLDTLAQKGDQKITHIDTIIDGRANNLGVDMQWLGKYNYGNLDVNTKYDFENLTPDQAATLVKQFLPNICKQLQTLEGKYPQVSFKGIQFDLEPFTLPADPSDVGVCSAATQPSTGCGSYNFYKAVETVLKDKANYPQCSGRYFSTFVMPDSLVNQTTGNIKPDTVALFGVPTDGTPSVAYPVLSMYDLGGIGNTTVAKLASDVPASMKGADLNTARGGFIASDPSYYDLEASAEMANVQTIDSAGIHYQLAIPAAASAHEFSGFHIQAQTSGDVYYAKPTGATTGAFTPLVATDDNSIYGTPQKPIGPYTQAADIQNVMGIIDQYRHDFKPKGYMGVTLWAFQAPNGNHWAPRNMVTNYNIPNEYTTLQGDSKDPKMAVVNPDVYMRLYTPNTICSTAGSSECATATDHTPDEQNVFDQMTTEVSKQGASSLFNFAGSTPPPSTESISWPDSANAIVAPYGVSSDNAIHGATLDASATLTNPQPGDVLTYACSIHTPAPAHAAVANTTCTIPKAGAVRLITISGTGLNPANGYAIYVSATVTRNGVTVPDAQVHWIRLYKEIPAATASESINWPTADSDVSIPSTYSGTSLTGSLTANAILLKPQDGDQLVYSCGVYDRSMKPVAGALCEVDASSGTQHKVDVSKIPSTATDLTIYFSATVSRDGKTVPSAKIPWIKVDKDAQRSS